MARITYEPTCQDHMMSMMERVVQVKANNIQLPQTKKPDPKNIANKTAPIKSDLVSQHKSRFVQNK